MDSEGVELFLLKITKIGIFISLLTPLVLGPFGINFVEYPKAVFFRSVIELVIALYLSLILFNKKYLPKLSPISLAIALFYVTMLISSILGTNLYRSFFGDMPRGEGLIMHVHLIAFFTVLTGILKSRDDWINFFGGLLL